MTDEQKTPFEELVHLVKVRLDDEKAYWRDKWTHHVDKPFKRTWSKRPWWLKSDPWRWIWRMMKPNIPKGWKSIKQYREQARLMKLARFIEDRFSYLVRDLRRSTYGSFVTINVDIQDTLSEAEPIISFLWDKGWSIEDRTDEYYGRKLKLTHSDWLVKLYVKLRANRRGGCEIVEHVEKEVRERVEYEVICEGERELTGRNV